ncbi:unnamed protein product [Symbiodinium sp. CCMP2592]|nr:unnamed protein product [Symbiodinium sp. CCMP2592]
MAPIGPAKAEGPGSPAFCPRRTSSRSSTRCESPPPRAFTPLSDTAPLILGRTSPEPPRCHSASGDYCASSRPPWRRRVQHRKNLAEEHQREISTKIAELAKRKEPQYPDGLDSDGLSCLFRGYTASVLKTQRTAHPMRKAAWSFVYRARASPQPDVPSSDNVAPIFHRHKEEKRGTCRRLEPSKPRSPPIAGLPPRRMQSSTQPPRGDSFEPAPAESFCLMPLPVIQDFDMPPSPDSKETQLKTAALTRQASRESTGSRVEEGDTDINDRAPQLARAKTVSQGQGSKNASSAPEDVEAFEEPGSGTPPSSKVAFRRQGSKSELQIEQQEKGLEVFYRLAESNKELHHSELPRALRMMGYMQPNDAWITDLLRAITSFNTVQVNEFLSLVHGYAQRHHDQRAATFAKYEDGHGHMSREGLQKASRDFGIELLPYVVEEVVAEVSQGFADRDLLDLPRFEKAMNLILGREGFSRQEHEEFAKLFLMHDRDGSGEIDSSELMVMLQWLGFSSCVSRAPQLLKQVDRDGNGEMNQMEFTACMRLVRDVELRAVRKLIQEVHGDGSGTLAVSEFPALLRALGYETWDPKVIGETLEDVGLASRKELELGDTWRILIEYRRNEGFCKEDREALESVFYQHDEDRSGELDSLEAPLALRKLGFAVGFNEAQSWLLKVDVDETGALSLEEFIKLARMLQSNEMMRYASAFREKAAWGPCSRRRAARLLASFGFTADVQVFGVDEDEEVSEDCFLIVCSRLFQERRKECRQNGGWNFEQMRLLKKVFETYDPHNNGYVGNKELIRLLSEILPNLSRDPFFRPELKAILQNVQVEGTGRLGFHDFLSLVQLCRSAQEKMVARRQQAAIEDTGFTQSDVQAYRDFFLAASANSNTVTFEEVWALFHSTTPLGNGLTETLHAAFEDQLRLRKDDQGEMQDDVLEFPDFLRLVKDLEDTNFAGLAKA